jgi:hypothetical protein
MGKIRKSDSNRPSKKSPKKSPTKGGLAAKLGKAVANKKKSPVKPTDKVKTPERKTTKSLERNAKETPSSPVASRRVRKKQSETASGITRGASSFDEAETEEKGIQLARYAGTNASSDVTDTPETESNGPDHLVGEEQRTDVRPPEGFEPGSPIQPVPDLSEQTPTNTRELPTGGTEETFETDGVTYTQTTRNGVVDTSYEIEGVDYNNTHYDDGRTSTRISTDRDDVLHNRTVERDAQGNLVEDKTQSSRGDLNPDTGEFHHESRTETLTGDGTRTTTEVNKVDGDARSYNSRIEDPEGNTRIARLDVPENLDPERFTEQLANFAENGDPTLLSTAISGIDSEQLQQVASSSYTADDRGEAFFNFVKATSAASAAGGPGTTSRLAGVLHDTLTDPALSEGNHSDSQVALYQGFHEFGAQGGDVALGVELIDRLRVTAGGDASNSDLAQTALTGPVLGGSGGVLSGVIDGLAVRSADFGGAADRVDELNRDLGYLTLNYGAFMTEDELAAAQEEFRQTHAEDYERFEERSAGIVTNVDNIQRLEEMKAEHEESDSGYNPFVAEYNLETVSENLLTQTRQASGSQQGRSELTTELRNAGRGRDSFLQDLGGLAGDSDEDAQQLEILKSNIFDTAVSQSAGAASVGDNEATHELLQGLGVSDPNIPQEAISALEEISGGAAELSDAHITRLSDALDGMPVGSALTTRLENAGALLGLAGLTANGIDILGGDASAATYIDTLAGGTELATDVFENALSQTFSRSGVQTAGKVAGGVGVLLSALGTVQSLADGDAASAGLNLAATVGGALTLSSSAALTGVGAVITVAAIAGQVGLAQYRNVQASNHFESADTERFVSHALGDANLTGDQQDAVLTELRNADSEGRLTGILFQQAAEQAGVPPKDFLTQIAQLDPDAVHDIVVTGHGVDPGDEGATDLSEAEVADFLEFVQNEYGVATG